MNKDVVDRFTREYYRSNVQMDMWWRGRRIVKNPCDLWSVTEIIAETKPDLIVETGSYEGGAALYYADIAETLYGPCTVVSIDLSPPTATDYPNVSFWMGSSTDQLVVRQTRAISLNYERVMVILDSDHSEAHVARELDLYAPLVTVGCYLIVEDSNPIAFQELPEVQGQTGPATAITRFKSTHPGFKSDRRRERFGLTFHPDGFLERVA